jgi:hypothetical protein
MTMLPTGLTQGLAAEHRRELLRTADGWRTMRTAILARRAAKQQRRLLADLAAAMPQATPHAAPATRATPAPATTRATPATPGTPATPVTAMATRR